MINHSRFIVLSLLLMCFQQQVNADPVHELTLSATAPEGQGLTSSSIVETFSEKINCRKTFKTKVVKNRKWTELPSGASPQTHVNILTVRFGKRTEYLAFMFEKPGGTINFAARAPVLEDQKVKYFFAASPGDYEVPRNAPTDLVANFANSFAARDKERQTIGVSIKAWREAEQLDSDELNVGASTVPSTGDLNKLQPIVCAALFQANVNPSLGKCDQTLTFAFRRQADGFDIKATYKGKGKTLTSVHCGALFEDLYYDVLIMAENLLHWQGALTDFARISDSRFTPLTVYQFKEERIEHAYVIGTRPGKPSLVQAFTTNKRQPAWESGRLAINNLIVKNGTLYQYQKSSIGKVDQKTSQLTELAPIGALTSTGVAIDDSSFATVGENSVSYAAKGKKVWEKTLKTGLSTGPAIAPKAIIISQVTGDCVAFSRADGTEQWRKPIKPLLTGQLTMVLGKCLGVSQDGMLTAIDPASGKVSWKAETGDVLVQPPLDADGSILAVSKANRLLLINPDDGTVIKSKTWPTWIRSVHYLADSKHLICIDLRSQVSVLNLTDFSVVSQHRLPFPMYPLMIPSAKFPDSWHGQRELISESKPAWLFFDQTGYMYIFNPAKMMKGSN